MDQQRLELQKHTGVSLELETSGRGPSVRREGGRERGEGVTGFLGLDLALENQQGPQGKKQGEDLME